MDIHLTALAGTTQSGTKEDTSKPPEPLPGLVVLWTGQRPQFRPIELSANIALTMGRDDLAGQPLPDDQVSRAHAQVMLRDGKHFELTDLNSRNGTFLNGERVNGTRPCPPGSLIRIGRTLMRVVADVRPLKSTLVSTENGYVVGPTLRAVLDRIQRSATGGANVLITGEEGTGKERAAGVFHKAATPRGPFIAVNCSTLSQPATAATQLFGSAAKTFTGVQGGPGLIEAADGGTLFLDEVGELPAEVQPQLLRAVEYGEVLRAGENEPRKVTVRFVCATNRDVRAQVESGKFRRDLRDRLAHVEVHLPPLRERFEEICYLVHQVIEPSGRVAHHEFIEAVLLREWRGNVRVLIHDIQAARLHAKHEILVRKEDLSVPPETPARPISETGTTIAFKEVAAKPAAERNPGKDKLLELKNQHGNWSAVARALGEQRTTVNRWREELGMTNEE
jgi:DNA-binding NtrC family response regulator